MLDAQLEDENDPDYANMTDSHMNDYFNQMQKEQQDTVPQQQQPKNKLQTIIETTLQLQYQICLKEDELKFYQAILAEKQSSIKKVKERYNKKNSKAGSLNEHLQQVDKKIKDIREGYKRISSKKDQYSLSQNTQRNQRLTYQEKKSGLYRKFCQMQENYSQILLELEQFGSIETEASQLRKQNQALHQEIQKIENRKKEMVSNEKKETKEQLKAEVNRLYERIKATEKEDQQICHEYQINRRALHQIQTQQLTINSKNLQIDALYLKMQKLKEDVKLRRWEKLDRQKTYNELLNQESDLKKELASQIEYRESQKKIKQNMVHNFKIIDSQADQEFMKLNDRLKNSPQQPQSSHVESQEQFDELINRFEKIKTKSKSGTS